MAGKERVVLHLGELSQETILWLQHDMDKLSGRIALAASRARSMIGAIK